MASRWVEPDTMPRSRSPILTDPSPETEILLATARAALDSAQRARLLAAVARGPDWHALTVAALAHGTAPFLCHHLLATVQEALPEDWAAAAVMHRDAARAAHGKAVTELLALLAALDRAGIPALTFKGPALAAQAYGDAAAPLRPSRDLDLLIRVRDLERCAAVLAGLGYRSPAADLRPPLLAAHRAQSGQDIFLAEGDAALPVEPHWEFAPRSFGTRLDPDGLWPRAVSVDLAGQGAARTLAPEDAMLVAGLHGTKEQWARLVWVADVAALLGRHGGTFDWDRVLERARAAGLHRMVLLAVALAEDLLGAGPLPPELRRAMAADAACPALVREVRDRLRPSAAIRAEPSVFHLSRFIWRAHDDLPARLRYLAATLTAVRPQHFRMLDLPASLSFAYPAVKIAHDYLARPLWLAGKGILRGVRPGSVTSGGVASHDASRQEPRAG